MERKLFKTRYRFEQNLKSKNNPHGIDENKSAEENSSAIIELIRRKLEAIELYEFNDEPFDRMYHCATEEIAWDFIVQWREILNFYPAYKRVDHIMNRYITTDSEYLMHNSYVASNAVGFAYAICQRSWEKVRYSIDWLKSIMNMLLHFLKRVTEPELPKSPLVLCRIANIMVGIIRILNMEPAMVNHFFDLDGHTIFSSIALYASGCPLDIFDYINESVRNSHPALWSR